MSQLLINEYLKQLTYQRIATDHVREAFKDLLAWGKQNLVFLAEYRWPPKATLPWMEPCCTNCDAVGYQPKTKAMILKQRSARNSRRVTRKTTSSFDDAVAVLWQNRAEVLRRHD
jgi:hypothetical protein